MVTGKFGYLWNNINGPTIWAGIQAEMGVRNPHALVDIAIKRHEARIVTREEV